MMTEMAYNVYMHGGGVEKDHRPLFMHFFYSCFCSFHVHESRYNVNIKILVCQIIGPAAAGRGPVKLMPVTSACCSIFTAAGRLVALWGRDEAMASCDV